MRLRHSVAVLCLALCAGAVPLGAQAGLFDDEEARARVDVLRKQMADANTKLVDANTNLETLNRNQRDFANQTESLRADLAKLRGQLEVLTFELETAQKRQKDFYIDLDNRVRKLETPPVVVEVPKPDDGAETRVYEAALAALKDLKYKEAAEQMGVFLTVYPNSALAASAHYFGGYAHAQVKNHAKAAELFGKFASNWPKDERVPGALESQVFSLEAIKDTKGANAALAILATQYASTDAGKRAQQRLKKK